MEKPQQIALVTGGAVRIGRALVLALAGNGFDVVIHYRHNREAAEETAHQVRATGRRAWTVCAAFDCATAAEPMFQEALAQAGQLDVLINNASLFTLGALAETSADDFESLWRINTLAPILLTRAFAAHIHSRGPATTGCVINLLDQRITSRCADRIAYGLSKRALADFTADAAAGLAPQVRVNAIAPGPVLPPPVGGPSETAGPVPLGRRPTLAEVAEAALYLIHAHAVTGQILFVDGGQHLGSQ